MSNPNRLTVEIGGFRKDGPVPVLIPAPIVKINGLLIPCVTGWEMESSSFDPVITLTLRPDSIEFLRAQSANTKESK